MVQTSPIRARAVRLSALGTRRARLYVSLMTNKKPERTEAMIDETLVETFPASDAPSWTLGVEDTSAAAEAPKGGTYQRRHAVLALLSDEEVARVSTLESEPGLAEGEEYIDLARPERGALRAQASNAVVMKDVLPRAAVSPETWSKILLAVHRSLVD